MPEESVHVSFVGSDTQFAEVIGRALGRGFELRVHNREIEPEREVWSDVVLLDSRDAEDASGLTEVLRLMEEIKRRVPSAPIIVMTLDEDRAQTRQLLESGAYDTVASPPDIVELRLVFRRAYKFHEVQREVLQLRSREGPVTIHDLVAASASMQPVLALAQKVAACDVNVLITGETGTGKGVLTRVIHRMSQRSAGPLVAFSCANMPESLVEDELFGHEKGAFTGAATLRRGRFEAAEGGTLFLDEIGDLPLGLQAKLLRILQERTFERLGSNTPRATNIRLVCATHRNLDEMVREGAFREDLYYRLNVVQIHLPALRERRDGIPILAYHFLQQFATQFNKPIKQFSGFAMHALEEYNWPGNVRELENVVQRAVVLAEGQTVETWHLPAHLSNGFEKPQLTHSYEEAVHDFKRRLVMRTLRECGGNKAETARVLGLARGYLHRLINQLMIEPQEGGTEDGVPEEPAPLRTDSDSDLDTHATATGARPGAKSLN